MPNDMRNLQRNLPVHEQRILPLPAEDLGDESTSEVQEGAGLEYTACRQPCSRKTAYAFTGFFAVALLAGLIWTKTRPCIHQEVKLGDTVQLDATSQLQALSDKLKGVTSKSAAEKIVSKTMQSGARTLMKKWEATKGHHAPVRLLPNSFIPERYPGDTRGIDQGTAQCVFNVMEAFTATIALGDDINGMARVCRPPRDTASELACQVDGGLLIAWIGTIAAKLSLATSNCAMTANIDAVCAAGITGIVAAFGELAGAAALAGPTCRPNPPQLPTTKISELGDQTLSNGRRLVIGFGAVGNGIQCGVDVSIVAENIANMGLAIHQAAKSGNCDGANFDPDGLVPALCAVDIAGAVTYFSQVITFIQLAILNCRDFLDIKALCGASIAGVLTSAAAIAPYASAIHAACTLNKKAKDATGGGRRLDEELEGMDVYEKLTHVTGKLKKTVASWKQADKKKDEMPEADIHQLIDLASPALDTSGPLRGASPLQAQQECQ